MKAVRQRALIDHLQRTQVASTATLTRTLGVSAATVRRDLDELVAAGQVERVFGGARLAGANERVDDPFDEVLGRNSSSKQSIGRLIASQIEPGQTIFVESGTTTFEVATALRAVELTVVTNSIRIADLLAPAPGIALVLLGGQVNPDYRCTQGPAALAELDELLIDVAVLGCSGIGEHGVARDTDPRAADLKRAACGRSTRTILTADHSKFPGIGAYTALDLRLVDLLVTDAPLPKGFPTLPTEVLHP